MVYQVLAYICVVIIVLVVALAYFKLVRPEKRLYDQFRAQGIRGEPFVPILGQLPAFRRSRKAGTGMDYFEGLRAKHGNTFLFGFGPLTRLIVTEPDLLADVLSRANAQNYIKPPMFNSVFIPIIGQHNLLVAEGSEHERARRMITPAFHHANLKSMVSIIAGQTQKCVEEMLIKSRTGTSHQQAINLQNECNALTLSIIASSAFGSGFETITNAQEIICKMSVEVLDAISYRSMMMINQVPLLSKLPFWKKDVVDRGARIIRQLVDQIISERRRGLSSSLSNGPDLLDLLLSAVDDHGQPFTDQEIKEESLTFVLAGSETTGNLMVWMLYVLMTDSQRAACLSRRGGQSSARRCRADQRASGRAPSLRSDDPRGASSLSTCTPLRTPLHP